MYREKVQEDLIDAERLKQADDIIDLEIMGHIKNLLWEKHGPKNSDWGINLGIIIGQIIATYSSALRGDIEETNKRGEYLMKISQDPHIRKREIFEKANYIVDNIDRKKLIDFYKVCRNAGPEIVVPGWMKMTPPRRATTGYYTVKKTGYYTVKKDQKKTENKH